MSRRPSRGEHQRDRLAFRPRRRESDNEPNGGSSRHSTEQYTPYHFQADNYYIRANYISSRYPPYYPKSFLYPTTYLQEPIPGWSGPPLSNYYVYGTKECTRYYEPSYSPKATRYYYSGRPVEDLDQQHPSYYGLDREPDFRYDYPKEEVRETRTDYVPHRHEDDREPHRSSRKAHGSRSHEKEHKSHKSSSRAHGSHPNGKEHKHHKSSSRAQPSRSHEEKREHHISSGRAHVSRSHEKEQKHHKSSRSTHVYSDAPGSSRKSKKEKSKTSSADYEPEPKSPHRSRKAKQKDYENDAAGFQPEGVDTESYFPWEVCSGYEDFESDSSAASEPEDDPNSPANNIPGPVRKALKQGKDSVDFLQFTINVVLLYEWCMTGYELHTHPGEFFTVFKVLPVERDGFGQLKPIEDAEGEWGVKTEYDPQYDTYLRTLLICVPSVLTKVTHAKLKSAYRRFTVEPRIDRMKEISVIPFKDHSHFRRYAIFFKFKSGNHKSRLFDDYLCEDAVIKIKGKSKEQ
ncbi:hypothetical protein F5Y12DRAFT_797423 [Xylaria sp. FL1777]|nr:hypothetical protein F5Y12DRAFT_797423 [Xylaria sp. FL1777]